MVDGQSLTARRDAADCAGTEAVNDRVAEVLGFFGSLPSKPCPPKVSLGVPDIPPPGFRTALLDAPPNPLTAGAEGAFRFTLAAPVRASLEIFDLNGRLVRTLFDGPAPAGETALRWDGRDRAGRPVAGGVCFYRFTASGATVSKKLVVVRSGR